MPIFNNYLFYVIVAAAGIFGVIIFRLVFRVLDRARRSVQNFGARLKNNRGRPWPELNDTPGGEYERVLRLAGYRGRLPRPAGVVIAVFILVLLGSAAGWTGFVLAVSAVTSTAVLVVRRARCLEKKIIAQLPDALTGLADTLRAGFSLSEAARFIENDLPNPVNAIFAALNRGGTMGLSFTEALDLVSKQMSILAWTTSAEILKAQIILGGNCVYLLKNQAASIQAEIRSERELQTLTAAGKTSGTILALLVPTVLLFFWLLSPSYVSGLTTTLIGKTLLGVSLTLEVIGWFWIRRIVRVV